LVLNILLSISSAGVSDSDPMHRYPNIRLFM